MKNSKITRKITQGMYVLTTKGGGCVVDAVSRVGAAGDQPLIAVAIAKTNKSNELLAQNPKFALSVLGKDVNPKLIQTFGFKSSRDLDKCAQCETETVEDVEVIKDSIGYMILEKVDSIENDTHTVFIGKLIEGDLFRPDAEPMSYGYYQEHKEELTKVTTQQNQTAWVCTACGYIYYGEEVPDDYICPLCGLGKSFFKKKES